jgi:hypothetical protein
VQVPDGGSVFQEDVAGAFQSFHKVERLVRAFLVSQLAVEFDQKRFVDFSLSDQWLFWI